MRSPLTFLLLTLALAGCPPGGGSSGGGSGSTGGGTGGSGGGSSGGSGGGMAFDGGYTRYLPGAFNAFGSRPLVVGAQILTSGEGIQLDGGNNGDVFLARFDKDGAKVKLDSTFGETAGFTLTDFDGGMLNTFYRNFDVGYDVAPAQNGYHVVGAAEGLFDHEKSNAAIAKYDNGGHLETSVGTGGKSVLRVSNGGTDFETFWLAALPAGSDGRFYAAGFLINGAGRGEDILVARFNANLTLDATFTGGTGIGVVADHGSENERGQFLIARTGGGVIVGGGEPFTVAAYDTGGATDTTFATSGLFTSPGHLFTGLPASNGDLLLVGARVDASTDGGSDRALLKIVRLSPAGVPVASYGTGGTAEFLLTDSPLAQVRGAALQGDDLIVYIAFNITTGGLVRIKNDGTLDPTLAGGNAGHVRPIAIRTPLFSAIAIDGCHHLAVDGNEAIITDSTLVDVKPGAQADIFALLREPL